MQRRPESNILNHAQVEQLRQRLQAVRHKVHAAEQKAGRPQNSVRLVAVSKYHPPEMVCALASWEAEKNRTEADSPAQYLFAENYVQEALEKQDIVSACLQANTVTRHIIPKLQWHFIGHIQRNKAKQLFGRYTLIHSLDSIRLAQTLHTVWQGLVDSGKQPEAQKVLIQVNIGDESQKNGVSMQELPALVDAVIALPGLQLQGLMGIAPVCTSSEAARPYFALLRKAREDLQKQSGLSLPELSMGMSMDMEAAVAEGATLVRIGTDIFGARA